MTSLTDELIEGQSIKIGRKVLVVPPLNFKQLKAMRPQIKLLSAMDPAAAEVSDAEMEAIVDIVHAAVRRNYPNHAREQIEDDLDMGNLAQIIKAVLQGSGLTRAGEATPGTKASP